MLGGVCARLAEEAMRGETGSAGTSPAQPPILSGGGEDEPMFDESRRDGYYDVSLRTNALAKTYDFQQIHVTDGRKTRWARAG